MLCTDTSEKSDCFFGFFFVYFATVCCLWRIFSVVVVAAVFVSFLVFSSNCNMIHFNLFLDALSLAYINLAKTFSIQIQILLSLLSLIALIINHFPLFLCLLQMHEIKYHIVDLKIMTLKQNRDKQKWESITEKNQLKRINCYTQIASLGAHGTTNLRKNYDMTS